MKLGIIIYSSDAEIVWNAFRLANVSRKKGDAVSVFLLAKGVEYESLDSATFNIKEQAQSLLGNGGSIFACGTCLKRRQSEGSQLCPVSTIEDLYRLVSGSDRVVSF